MYHLYNEDDKITVLNEATIIQWAFADDGSNILNCLKNNMLTSDFKCISKPVDLFELVRIDDISRLNEKCKLNRLKIVATDLFTHYIGNRIDSWSDEVYNTYFNYHMTECEREDLLGVTNHSLDILIK